MQIIKKTLIASSVSAFFLLSGCATPGHVVPKTDAASQRSAQREIASLEAVAPKYWSDEKAERKIYQVYKRLVPAATEICKYVGEDECWWEVEYSSDKNINAHASGESKVVIQKGILQYAKTDDEIAMVVAHEISHHIANHIEEDRQNAAVGALALGILTAVAVSYGGGYNNNPYAAQSAINNSMQVGANFGQLSYSKKQEAEADYLAAYILKRSGYDLKKAERMLLILGKKSGKTSSNAFDTHPAGPERLAQWKKVRRTLGANPSALPTKVSKTSYKGAGNKGGTTDYIFDTSSR